MCEVKINIDKELPVKFGQRLFIIRPSESDMIREKCPICDDLGKITLKGIAGLACPYCSGYLSHADRSRNNIPIHKYSIYECVVNRMEFVGEETVNKYKDDGYPSPRVNMRGFYKTGNGYHNTYDVPLMNAKIDVIPENFAGTSSDYVFTTRKLAEQARRKYVEYEIAGIDRFNDDHGTDFTYPWDEDIVREYRAANSHKN